MYIIDINKLKELRKENQLSQEDIAKSLFIDQSKYNRIESGKLIPKIDLVKRLADFFKLNVEELIKESTSNNVHINNNKGVCGNYISIENYNESQEKMLEKLQNNLTEIQKLFELALKNNIKNN